MTQRLALDGGSPAIPYLLPSVKDISGRDIGEEELALVTEVVRSGNLGYIYGTKVKQLQKEWAQLYGIDNAVAVSSGTAALHTALVFLDLGPGDEVLVPAITDMGTVIAVLLQNAVPVFVDVDRITQLMDPNKIAEKITPNTKAIIPVHLYGMPCDMDPILEIARKHNLYVVEDCAQAQLTKYKGRYVGSIGDVGCFSFQQSKQMTTGDGGMVIARQDELCGRKLVQCADKGWPRELYRDHLFLAPNYHMTELQAAVGIGQLHKLESMIERRRQSAAALTDSIRLLEGVYPPGDNDYGRCTYYEYALPIEPDRFSVSSEIIAQALTAEGVKTAPGYLPQPIYMYDMVWKQITYGKKKCPYNCAHYPQPVQYTPDMCPVAVEACQSMLFIPWNEKITVDMARDIGGAIRKVLTHYKK